MAASQVVEIRRAGMQDYEAVCDLFRRLDNLHVQLLPHNFQSFEGPVRPRELFREKVDSLDRAFFIAISETKAVGFVDVQSSTNPPFPVFRPRQFALLDNLFVLEEFRGTGLAKTLFERAKEWARERQLASLQLKVYCANRAALRFYEKEGLTPLSTTFELEL